MRITSKFQTTIPKQVRNALNIRVGDNIVAAYAQALRSTLSEWDSKQDDEAFRDLQDL